MTAIRILQTILAIGILMIVHEGGHYLAARMFGMRVLRFSIGIGPTLWKRQVGEHGTIFQVALIPFLAYVQIAGMSPAEEIDPHDRSLFPNQGVFARITTIAAGPIANYLFASLIIFGIALLGWPDNRVVTEVVEGSPAAIAGLQSGDIMLRVENTVVRGIEDVQQVTQSRAGKPTHYVVQRHGQRLSFTMTPKAEQGTGRIGVAFGNDGVGAKVALPLDRAAELAMQWPLRQLTANIAAFSQMIKHPSTQHLSGPVGMAREGTRQAERGIVPFLFFTAAISTALVFFNFLPFPGLDGGRLAFLFYEVISRRRVNEQVEMVVHVVGILFLLGLMVLITFQDIARFFS